MLNGDIKVIEEMYIHYHNTREILNLNIKGNCSRMINILNIY